MLNRETIATGHRTVCKYLPLPVRLAFCGRVKFSPGLDAKGCRSKGNDFDRIGPLFSPSRNWTLAREGVSARLDHVILIPFKLFFWPPA
jgi:hypothetical protein